MRTRYERASPNNHPCYSGRRYCCRMPVKGSEKYQQSGVASHAIAAARTGAVAR